MQATDNKSSRRSSFTHIFSPTRHHESTLRKRAQSLHAQSTRRNSILLNNDSHPYNQGTADRKSVLKLSISAPLSSSHYSRSHYTSDTDATSAPTSRTSFINTRQCEDPPNSTERKVQFVELSLDHSRSSMRETMRTHSASIRTHNTTIKKRTVARVSITSGRIYYIEEAIPEFQFPSTRFSPPPSATPRAHSYPIFHSRSLSTISIRRQPLSSTHLGCGVNRYTHHFANDYQNDHFDDTEGVGRGLQTGVGNSNRSFSFTSPPAPLYVSTSEKLHARWGTFTLNMRFSMFRAQDKVKNGVVWMGGVVKRLKPRRQI